MAPLIVRGRYQIVPEGADKPKAYTRVTNFAKKLEDESFAEFTDRVPKAEILTALEGA